MFAENAGLPWAARVPSPEGCEHQSAAEIGLGQGENWHVLAGDFLEVLMWLTTKSADRSAGSAICSRTTRGCASVLHPPYKQESLMECEGIHSVCEAQHCPMQRRQVQTNKREGKSKALREKEAV